MATGDPNIPDDCDVVLTLRSEPGLCGTVASRLRILLKRLLRLYGWRCIRVEYLHRERTEERHGND